MSAVLGNAGAWNLSSEDRMAMMLRNLQNIDDSPMVELDRKQKVQQFVERINNYVQKLLENQKEMQSLIGKLISGLSELNSLEAMRQRNIELIEHNAGVQTIRNGLMGRLKIVTIELIEAQSQKQRLIEKLNNLIAKLAIDTRTDTKVIMETVANVISRYNYR